MKNFWRSAFSGRWGNASIIRVLNTMVVFSVVLFMWAVTWKFLIDDDFPMIQPEYLLFLGGLPAMLGAIIKWGDSIDASTPPKEKQTP